MKINGEKSKWGEGWACLPVGRNIKKPIAFILLLRGKLLQASTCLVFSENKIVGVSGVMIIEMVRYNLVTAPSSL